MSDGHRRATLAADEELSVSHAVLEAVADVTERDVTALPPLSRAVDPEALDALLAPGPGGGGPLGASFQYGGCRVTVEREPEDAVTVTVAVTDEAE